MKCQKGQRPVPDEAPPKKRSVKKPPAAPAPPDPTPPPTPDDKPRDDAKALRLKLRDAHRKVEHAVVAFAALDSALLSLQSQAQAQTPGKDLAVFLDAVQANARALAIALKQAEETAKPSPDAFSRYAGLAVMQAGLLGGPVLQAFAK